MWNEQDNMKAFTTPKTGMQPRPKSAKKAMQQTSPSSLPLGGTSSRQTKIAVTSWRSTQRWQKKTRLDTKKKRVETPEPKKVKSKKSKAQIDEGKSDEEPEPKKGKSKKGKSEDKPQSGKKMNGYTHFCSLNRASVKEDNPEMSATEITKELARQWKELDEEEQNEWKEVVQTV